MLVREKLLEKTLILLPYKDRLASVKAISLFERLSQHSFRILNKETPIALYPTKSGHALLASEKAIATAYLLALRGFIQGVDSADFNASIQIY